MGFFGAFLVDEEDCLFGGACHGAHLFLCCFADLVFLAEFFSYGVQNGFQVVQSCGTLIWYRIGWVEYFIVS